MAELEVIEYLSSKGLKGRRATGLEYAFPCFMDCNESPDSKKKKLYVHSDEGWFHCKVCEAKGGPFLLQRHFGDVENKIVVNDTERRRELLDDATAVAHEMLLNNDGGLYYLYKERGLSMKTITDRKLGFIPKGWSLIGSLKGSYSKDELKEAGLAYVDGPNEGRDFYYNHHIIPYLSHGSTVALRGRLFGETTGARYVSGRDQVARLFDYNQMDHADDVIVCEAELDAIILQQAIDESNDKKLKKFVTVALAGTQSKPQNFESYFKNIKRVYVGFDSDQPGIKAAFALKDSFGSRGRILELPEVEDGKVDWGTFLLPVPDGADDLWHYRHPEAGHTWRDVIGLINNASGKRVWSIRDAGMSWREREKLGPGLRTGFERLDASLYPGLHGGDLCVILADTNVGKTNFLCNLAFKMRKHRTLFISLEATREELYERFKMIYLFYEPGASDTVIEEALENIFIVDENSLSKKDLEELISEFEAESGGKPEQIFVDYLQYFARGQPGSGTTEKATNAIMQLKEVAKKGRYVIWVPSQVTKSDEMGKPLGLKSGKDSASIAHTGNVIISLYSPDSALSIDSQVVPSGKIKCDILKTKRGGEGKFFWIQYDAMTLAMVDQDDRLAEEAKRNARLKHEGQTYRMFRQRQLEGKQGKLL